MSGTRMTTLAFFFLEFYPRLVFEFDFLSALLEYFHDIWWICRTG